MLSNGNKLLKWNWVSVDSEDSRIIDNNQLLEKRLSENAAKGVMKPINLAAMADGSSEGSYPEGEGREEQGFSTDDDFAPGEFRGGLAFTELDGILEDPDDPSTLIKAAALSEPQYDGPSPQELIDEANAKISEMYENAQNDIDRMRSQALEEGRAMGMEQGYSEGIAKAQEEIASRMSSLESEYAAMIKDLEPRFVKHISGIYEHIFRVSLSHYETLVMQLIENCLSRTEGSSAYIVRVSVDDYPYVTMQKKALFEIISGRNSTLDIIEDNTLRKNECMIETDGGIYDCSLDAQLSALRRELMLLAYQGDE